MNDKGVGKKIFLGTIIGLGVGYLAGILTAPKSGKETREQIKETSSKAIKQAENKLKTLYSDLTIGVERLTEKAKEVSSRGKNELEKLSGEAKDAQQKVKEMLSAIRNGEAEDPELNTAIDQAIEAMNHLKEYFRKSR